MSRGALEDLGGLLDACPVAPGMRVTIEAARTDGTVLVVPLSAVTARADGSSVVSVLAPGAGQGAAPRFVAVKLGLDTDGYVAVTPTGGGGLRAGDQVVVGVRAS